MMFHWSYSSQKEGQETVVKIIGLKRTMFKRTMCWFIPNERVESKSYGFEELNGQAKS